VAAGRKIVVTVDRGIVGTKPIRPAILGAVPIRVLTARFPVALSAALLGSSTFGQAKPQDPSEIDFQRDVRPVLAEYCFRCHGPDEQKGDMRLDVLDPDVVNGADAEAWHLVLDMVGGGEMPPDDEPQPVDAERRRVVEWLTESVERASRARAGRHGTVLRRLNRASYTNTLQDLLGVGIDFGNVLPGDGKSKAGFTNNGEVLATSPLHLDYWQAIARQALAQAILSGERPASARYRVTFGKGIGKGRVAGTTGGYQAVPLPTDDFVVDILDATGEPVVGADEAERAALDAIRRKISVGLRGSSHERFCVVEDGVVLYGALPHKEVAPGSWQGPSPNLKLELQRCFPETGDLVMRVVASRGYFPPTQEQLLVGLDEPSPRASFDPDTGALVVASGSLVVAATGSDQRKNLALDDATLRAVDVPQDSSARVRVQLPHDGCWQVDLVHPVAPSDAMPSVRLSLGRQSLDRRLEFDDAARARGRVVTALGALALRAGDHHLKVGGPFFVGFSELVLTPLEEGQPLVARLREKSDDLLARVADRVPALRVYAGTRTDDGMDYRTFDRPREVHAPLGRLEAFEFRGRLENLPIPEPESGDTEILSGILVLGLWNDHLAKAPGDRGPPLLLRSIEVEAPYFAEWPPESHTAIFFDSPHPPASEEYTRAVLSRFVARAFRRAVDGDEIERYLGFWRAIRDDHPTYEDGVREVLVAVLCSPSFLFLTEPSAEHLGDDALASRLSYFLWNSPPDETLRALAARGQLRARLGAQVDRMIEDERVWRFVRSFTREWLRLDRLEQMAVDADAFPAFTRFVKRDMAEETYAFVHRVVRDDLPIATLIDSDFAMLNQNLAEFYGIAGVRGPQFRPVAVTPEQRRGGLLSQGAFLCGHSDGSEPHPIKRAVWLKEKILGESPPKPPPNVPPLDPETPGFEKLTLKQQLEAHRENPSCTDCHRSIDPYGVAFERYSAVGLYEEGRRGMPIDASSTLPDGTDVDGVDALKAWLRGARHDTVARALIEHLFGYALGRDVGFGDEAELSDILAAVRADGYRMRSVVRHIVTSSSFVRP
jgi:hypothetical protein